MGHIRFRETGDRVTIGKIVCIGRNYSEHIRELGNEVPDRPILFMKPAASIIPSEGKIKIPSYSHDCHHEVELALLIGRRTENITEDEALSCIAGYGVAIDLTLRDVQNQLKTKGLPWEMAKAFETSCPLSDFVAASTVADPQNLPLRLSVNGQLRQDANTSLMIRPIPLLLKEISAIFPLDAGDIVLTGTPAGVGPIVSGDRLLAEIDTVGRLEVAVA